MENYYLMIIKDVLVVLSPILVAYINYRSNKKSQRDIKLEIEKTTKEKDTETKQILQKISAELESQKQLISWQNSIPQTNEYISEGGTKRWGNVLNLNQLVMKVNEWLECGKYTQEELIELKDMLKRISLPSDDEELYPYEIPFLLEYKSLMRKIEDLINRSTDEERR